MQEILQSISEVQIQLRKAIHLISQIEQKIIGNQQKPLDTSIPLRIKIKSNKRTTNLPTSEKFKILSKSLAGRFILDLEEDELSYFLEYEALQELYNARIDFNTGQANGVEIFKKYMPKRNALSGSLQASYDEQFQRIYYHILANSFFTDFHGKPEPSLVFLMAIAMAESIAEAPHLVEEVLTKISQGYFVTIKQNEIKIKSKDFRSSKIQVSLKWMRIDLNLRSFLTSFIIPGASDKFMNHKLSFFLKSYEKIRGIEGVPIYMDHNDAASFIKIRERYLKNYRMHGITPNGWNQKILEKLDDFWNKLSELFLSGRFGARKIALESPELYGILSRYYVRRYRGLGSE